MHAEISMAFRHWLRWAGSLAVVILLIPVSAGAQARQSPRKSRAGHRAVQWWEAGTTAKDLGLSQDQVTRIADLYTTSNQAIRQARVEARKSYQKLFAAMSEGGPNSQEVAKARSAFEEAEEHLIELQLQRLAGLRELLTGQQWDKLPNTAPRALRLGMMFALRGQHRVRISKTGEVTQIE